MRLKRKQEASQAWAHAHISPVNGFYPASVRHLPYNLRQQVPEGEKFTQALVSTVTDSMVQGFSPSRITSETHVQANVRLEEDAIATDRGRYVSTTTAYRSEKTCKTGKSRSDSNSLTSFTLYFFNNQMNIVVLRTSPHFDWTSALNYSMELFLIGEIEAPQPNQTLMKFR